MSDRGLYLSYGLQAVDAKGRVAVPVRLRAVLERNSDARELLIERNLTHCCLTAFDSQWPMLRHERIDPRERQLEEAGESIDYNVAGTAFGDMEVVPFDSAGRFVLPSSFRRRAGIDKWAFFHGRGNTFTIWSPDRMLADPAIAQSTRELLEDAMIDRGLA